MRHHIQSRGHLERHFRCLPLSLFKYFGPERVIMSLHREAAVIEKKKMNLMKITGMSGVFEISFKRPSNIANTHHPGAGEATRLPFSDPHSTAE